jgi:FkbM family methyltransferase
MGGAAGGGLDMNMLPPGGPLEMQKTAVGMLMFSPRDTGVGIYLDKYGEYGRDELDLLKQVIREGDVVVDAGAQYGVTALGLAQVVGPQGTVYAFEPQRVLHQTLCSNFAMNSATNCHCKHEALGQQPGEAVVPALDQMTEGCHGCTALDASNYLGETVKMTSVDTLNLPKMRLLKVDVEGMELDVVRGAVKTINMFKPALYMRAHYNPEDNTCVPLASPRSCIQPVVKRVGIKQHGSLSKQCSSARFGSEAVHATSRSKHASASKHLGSVANACLVALQMRCRCMLGSEAVHSTSRSKCDPPSISRK